MLIIINGFRNARLSMRRQRAKINNVLNQVSWSRKYVAKKKTRNISKNSIDFNTTYKYYTRMYAHEASIANVYSIIRD